MGVTNTKESGLEELIAAYLVEHNGYEEGKNATYNKEYAVDEDKLFRFLQKTQPEQMDMLGVFKSAPKKREFLYRLNTELIKNGIIEVLRNGIKAYPAGSITLFYATPSENNTKARELFKENIFSVTRQLRYSQGNGNLALDMCVFINGLPVITFELKNRLTKQNVEDAVEQYKTDRDARELLFSFKRCMVHFAADDARIKFCTKLAGKDSWFLPFDKGYNDGAGNPPNPNGIMTDYLWKDILTKEKLSLIIENYAQVVISTAKDKKKTEKQIFPRYHQLDAVTKILAHVKEHGVGQKYLIQHSAGSGKSNSIAWLAHQLVGLEDNGRPMLDSVIVLTDRRILDRQIRDTIKQFMQVHNIMEWAKSAEDLAKAIAGGKRIIVSTVEKFPYIKDIGDAHKHNRFAIIIDEAHSGQSGKNSAQMNLALSGVAFDEGMDNEDRINALAEGRKLLTNASYFAFTATPKNKTLEIFGVPYKEGEDIKHKPFHIYTMKQAIQEGFILDVLQNYTSIDSFCRLIKTVADDPEFDNKKAQKKLRSFVEGNSKTIAQKAAIMVEHFHTHAAHKIGGKARAMVVTESIPRCISYYYAINKCLKERNSPYKAIIAFSGENKERTSAGLNGFADGGIPQEFKKDPYRFLIVADMFQTGFDEPLLHTMYVDKMLYGIAAVQTLSRLNRCHPQKYDTCVLDFANTPEMIEESFSRYYRTTLLSKETDRNKLYDLISAMEKYQVYSTEDEENIVNLFLGGAERPELDKVLDACAERYKDLETEDDKVKFKSAAKSFCRTYGFLGSILPYTNTEWEKLSIFLNLLIPKLPSPIDPDLTEGLLEAVDLESYRNEVKEAMSITLADEDAEIDPVPTGSGGHIAEVQIDALSNIVSEFNGIFGNIAWEQKDNAHRQAMELPAMVSKNETYRNAMKNSDEQEARTECDNALEEVLYAVLTDNTELLKQYQDNPSFKKGLLDMVFSLTYNKEGKIYEAPKGSLPPRA